MVHQHRVHSDGVQWAIKKGKIVAAPTYSPLKQCIIMVAINGGCPYRFLKASTSREDARYRG